MPGATDVGDGAADEAREPAAAAADEEPAPPAADTEREPPAAAAARLGRLPWLAVAPVLIALLSLAVAAYGLIEARANPEIHLSLPDRVRIAAGPDGAWLYLQPRFVHTGRNDRVEIVTGIEATLVAPDGERLALRWDEQGTWVYDAGTRSLTWVFLADPAPLAVTRLAPQMPTGLFIAPDGWAWTAGDYRIELTARRQTSHGPLTGGITFSLAPAGAALIRDNPGTFVEIPASPARDA